MADENIDVRILTWPDQAVGLSHQFDADNPVPIDVSFTENPVTVNIGTSPGMSLNVNMDMNLNVCETLPVCLSVCEPICIQSDYKIQLNLFNRPAISIAIKGKTVLYNCGEGV